MHVARIPAPARGAAARRRCRAPSRSPSSGALPAGRFDVDVACPRGSLTWTALEGQDGVALHAIRRHRRPRPGDARSWATLLRLVRRADVDPRPLVEGRLPRPARGGRARAPAGAACSRRTAGRSGRRDGAEARLYRSLERLAAHWCRTIVALSEDEREAGLRGPGGRAGAVPRDPERRPARTLRAAAAARPRPDPDGRPARAAEAAGPGAPRARLGAGAGPGGGAARRRRRPARAGGRSARRRARARRRGPLPRQPRRRRPSCSPRPSARCSRATTRAARWRSSRRWPRGSPVVATAVGGVGELVREGSTGALGAARATPKGSRGRSWRFSPTRSGPRRWAPRAAGVARGRAVAGAHGRAAGGPLRGASRVDASNEGVAPKTRTDDANGVTAAGSRRFVRLPPPFRSRPARRTGDARAAPTSARRQRIAALRICSELRADGRRPLPVPLRDPQLLGRAHDPGAEGGEPRAQGARLQEPQLHRLVRLLGTASTCRTRRPASATATQTSNHPDWFLTDPSGNRLNSSGFPQAWMMDVGNAAYQAKWLSNVLADVRAGGWDGVFMDDTDADMSWHLNGRTIAQVPDRRVLARRDPQHARDRGAVAARRPACWRSPNLSAPWAADYDAQATWSDWLQFTSGAAQEYYSKWGSASSGWFAGSDWTYRQQFQALTEQAGQDLPRHHLRAASRHALDDLGARELPALRRARQRRRADVRAERPRGAGSVHAELDGGRRLACRGRASRSARPGGATSPAARCSSTRPALDGDRAARAGPTSTPTTDPGQPRSRSARRAARSCAPRPARAAPPPPAQPPPPPRGLVARRVGLRHQGELRWTGLSASRVDIFRNGGRKATVANSGSYVDRLSRKPNGTYSYKRLRGRHLDLLERRHGDRRLDTRTGSRPHRVRAH